MSKPFTFEPSRWVPFRDRQAVQRCRAISRNELTRHANPDYQIRIIPDADVQDLWLDDIFQRIKHASEAGQSLVMIMPNPWPGYRLLAERINAARLSCHHLHTFNMDEYANEDGEIAPESWPYGFNHAFKKYFYATLDAALRPPESQVHGLTNANLNDYGTMLADLGGADICYSGPGWTGHLAFIEPDAPEFATEDLDAYLAMGPRLCTLSPFTIAQNALHACFGASGDLCAVPPMAATIGPAEVVGAKHRIDLHTITVGGSQHAWQRTMSRLVMHGPVTPRIPSSILQLMRTDVWVSASIAADIVEDESGGY